MAVTKRLTNLLRGICLFPRPVLAARSWKVSQKLSVVATMLCFASPVFGQISFDSVSSGTTTATTLTFSHTIGGGVDRLLVLSVAVEGATPANAEITGSPTFNGVALTKAIDRVTGTSFGMNVELWYMLDANLPAAGTYTVSITASSSDEISGGVVSVSGAEQQPPEATGSNADEQTGSSTIQTTVTTTTTNAWLFDGVGSGEAVSEFTPDAGQTERWDQVAASSRGAGSTKIKPVPGLVSMGWTAGSSSNRIAHVVAAFAATVGCSFDAECDDANPCTDDTCNGGSICQHIINNANPCDDGDLCTLSDACVSGGCVGTFDPACSATGFQSPASTTARQTAWATPTQAFSSDNLYAVSGNDSSVQQDWTNFGLTIPAGATVDGIELRLEHKHKKDNETGIYTCQLIDGSGLLGLAKNGPDHGHKAEAIELLPVASGPTDTWSAVLTETVVESPAFGITCYYTKTAAAGGNKLSVDHLQIIVYYTAQCAVDGDCDDGNQCTVDTCVAQSCQNNALADGTTCNDGDVCIVNETCQGGVCGSGVPADCSGAGGTCNTAACDTLGEDEGNCDTLTPTNEGLSCDDGLFCNTGEICTAGVCGGGSANDCSGSGDQCNTGVCNETTDACEGQAANEGLGCDDGLFCNTGETCIAGVCGGGLATDCSGSSDQCNVGVCNETTDACEAQAANEGLGCDDGLFCNSGEICTAGVCGGGSATDCSGAGDQCNVGVCNETTDACEAQSANEGLGCNDTLFCTTGETCTAGVCSGGSATDCSASTDQCNLGVCNETTDACEGQAANEGLACDDSQFCTVGETCTGGVCGGGSATDCSGFTDQCNLGVCNETTDACEAQTANEGFACDDTLFCTTGEICTLGVCGGGSPTDCSSLDDQCNVGVCNETTDVCDAQTINEGLACNDGLFCTVSEICTAGVCGGGFATDCSAFTDQCNTGVCNETTNVCEAQSANEGLGCDDAQFCTVGETCTTGICGGGSPTDCSAFTDQCNLGVCNDTLDVCEAQTANEGAACDDGLFCNAGETCTVGVCGGGGATDCSSLDDQCNLGVCNETTDTCEAQSVNEGLGCSDGDLCTTGDVCTAGACAGIVTDCSGLDDQCNIGVCNVGTGVCEAQTANEGLGCNDGDLCTSPDTCTSGLCAGPPVSCPGQICDSADGLCKDCLLNADCDDSDVCTDDLCTTGVCSNPNNTATCDDGDLCTTGDICGGGLCDGTPVTCSGVQTCDPADGVCKDCLVDIDCDDSNVCTDDTCNAGVCEHANNADTCDDSDLCTTGDVCSAGACGGAATDCTAVDDPCNIGVCNAGTGLCEAQPVNEGLACDDGLFCNSGETCTVGVCGGGAATDCSGAGDQCNVGVCNETTDTCDAQSANEGLACNDGLFCSTGETCAAGVCGGGTATDCSAFDDQCNLGVCNETTDVCEAQSANEGLGCNDGQFCTTGETCTLGVCGGGAATDCTAFTDQCNLGVCNETTDVCEAQSANEGLGCDDGQFCTIGEVCTLGVCGGGSATDCSGADDQCNLGVCNEGTDLCEPQPANEGFGCDDGLFCTVSETCLVGICGGGAATDCSAFDDQCNLGVCNETTDACEAQAANEGGVCDDGLFCNTGETCTAGVCGGGGATDWSAFTDQCNLGVCNETTDLCEAQSANEGLACDDGLFCNTGETCTAGVCGGGAGTDCSGLDDPCNTGVCNETTDACEAQSANEGLACDDGQFCTTGETCTAGVCGGGAATDCTGLDDQCNTGVCNETTDACEAQSANEGLACDDGQFCTTSETCTAGTCGGGAATDCSGAGDQCNVGVCNDVTDACEPQSANEGVGCDDGLFCTAGETCTAGVCGGGGATDCSGAGDQCNTGVCNETTEACEAQPANEGLPCDDGLFCNTGETCSAGVCGGGSTTDCTAQDDQCNVGVCNETTDACEPQSANEGAGCDDGLFCTTGETCTTGTCGGGAATDCTSLDDQCNSGVCNETTDACEAQAANEGAACDDGLFCNAGETCTAGVCGGGAATECTAQDDQCNLGVCNETTDACEAQAANEGGVCDDGLFCNTGETCTAGVCNGGAATDCTSLDDQCNLGTCNETTDACEAQAANEGLGCDDSDLCTTGDVCSAGVCGGAATDCSGLDDQCNVGACNAGTGACEAQATNEGLGCNDADLCTTGDICTLGVCGGAVTDCSGLDDQCNVGACNAGTGVCEAQPANEGLSCSDGQLCTTGDVCTAGTCGGASTDCSGLDDQCNVGVCNAGTGVCEPQTANEGLGCDDGALCTTGDICSTGTCAGTPVTCTGGQVCDPADGVCKNCLTDGDCDDSNPCTDDTCGAGTCSNTNNFVSCNDGNLCTTGDTCSGGACGGTATDCSGLDDQCNIGVCNAGTGACETQPANESGACDDGQFCTTGEVCTLGVCGGGGPTDCTSVDDQCNVGVCNETTDACEAQATNEGVACDDTLFCTAGETCTAGVCGGGGATDCTAASDQCNLGVCNETTDACEPQAANEAGACDDSLFCTTGETCTAGVCGGGAATDCTSL